MCARVLPLCPVAPLPAVSAPVPVVSWWHLVANRKILRRHETMMGSINDPKDGKAVASTITASVLVYAVCAHLLGPLALS